MVNVIICDDNDKDRNNILNIVKCFMDKNKIEYQTHVYNDYNKKFNEVIDNKLSFKIYLLDIETPSASGIDIARKIRKRDVDSVIVFLTVHEELGNVILKNDLMFLSFINKFDNFTERLNNSLYKAINILKYKQTLKIEDRNTVYILNMDDILYITKESFERKTVIVTDYNEFKVNKTLNEIISKLDERFIQTHRACYINKNRLSKLDKTRKEITFDNSIVIDLISDKYKRSIIC